MLDSTGESLKNPFAMSSVRACEHQPNRKAGARRGCAADQSGARRTKRV